MVSVWLIAHARLIRARIRERMSGGSLSGPFGSQTFASTTKPAA